jgi:hypothetical protein
LLLLFDSGKEDLLETIQEKTGEERTIFEENEKPRNMETRKEQRWQSEETRRSTRISQNARENLIPYSDYLGVVIALSTGTADAVTTIGSAHYLFNSLKILSEISGDRLLTI